MDGLSGLEKVFKEEFPKKVKIYMLKIYKYSLTNNGKKTVISVSRKYKKIVNSSKNFQRKLSKKILEEFINLKSNC